MSPSPRWRWPVRIGLVIAAFALGAWGMFTVRFFLGTLPHGGAW